MSFKFKSFLFFKIPILLNWTINILFLSIFLTPNLKMDWLTFFLSIYNHLLLSNSLIDEGGPIISIISFLLVLLIIIFSYFVCKELNPWLFDTLFVEQFSVNKNNKIKKNL